MKKLRSILLIDDNDTSNFLNERLLKRMDLSDHIEVISNGKNAFEYLEDLSKASGSGTEIKPELIFLDINMPVLDGFEFLELFQNLDAQFRQDILVVILSTSSHPQDTSKAAEFNAFYITKPLTVEKVEALLATHPGGAAKF